jgi:importin-7
VQASKETIIELEAVLLPLLAILCKPDNIDYLDDALSIFSVLTFVPNAVSEDIWTFFPILHDLFLNHATDYFEAFLPIFDNYISVGKERFLSGIPGQANYYKDAVFNIISRIMDPASELHGMERSLWEPVKLIEVVLQNCKGSIDDYLPQYLRMTVHLLSTLTKNSSRTLFFNVVSDAFLYNAQMTAGILLEDGVLDEVLTSWLLLIPTLKREYDKRVWVLGLSSILDVAPCDAVSVDRVEPILSGCLQIFKSIETAANEGEPEEVEESEDYGSSEYLLDAYRSLTAGGGIGDDDGDGDGDGDIADEEDIFTTDDRVYLEALKNKLEAAKNGLFDDDDSFSLQSGDEYVTPFDDVNESQTFCGVVEEMKSRFQNIGADLQSLVSEQTFGMLMEFMAAREYNGGM